MRWLVAVTMIIGMITNIQVALAGSDPEGSQSWFSVQRLPGTHQPQAVAAWLQLAAEREAQPENSYHYEVQGRRDPFESLIKEKPPTEAAGPVIDPGRPPGPLERFDLAALKLMGIVWGELGRRAIIRAPDGKGYFAAVGTYLGQNGGKIVAIEDDRMVIEERYRDTDGNVVGKTLTVPLRSKDKQRG
ncbi:MAG TPA: pilus assembly protein PilP [Candidatus Tectomicrobia bacterium]|jgi:type IV pilus assembly protein PilP